VKNNEEETAALITVTDNPLNKPIKPYYAIICLKAPVIPRYFGTRFSLLA
jgi:hypothetical protein